MSWTALFVPTLVALALTTIPGLLVTLASGLRGFAALSAAPLISVSIIALSGVLGTPQPFPWWMLVPALTAAMVAAGWAAGRLAPREAKALAPRDVWHAGDLPWYLATALATVLWLRHMRNVLDTPDAFSQTFDNVWHLNAIRYIVDSGNASSLTLAKLNAGVEPTSGLGTFYPAAFHDLSAAVMLATGAPIAHSVNAVLVVIVSWAWPLSLLFAIRAALRPHPATVLGAGVLAASFPLFPLLLLDFGVLYPNLLGYALLPTLVGLGTQWLGLGRERWLPWQRGVALGVLGAPGLLLSHPNAGMALLLVAAPMLLTMAWRAIRMWRDGTASRTASMLRILSTVAALGVAVVAWKILRPPVSVGDWPPPLNEQSAVGHALVNAPVWLGPTWTGSLLMLVGLWAAWRRGLGWMVGSWLVVVFFWVVVSSWSPGRLRLFLTGPWYQDSIRFSATLALVAVPLAVVGLDALVGLIAARLARRSGPPFLPGRWMLVFSLVLVLALVVTTQRTKWMDAAVERASSMYAVTPDAPLIDSDEYALLMRLPAQVPADAVVATNPWNGSALVYALTGRMALAPHMFYGDTPARVMAARHLDELASNPAVCPVLNAAHVTYVLDFGPKEVHGASHPYPGLDELATAQGFELVDQEGHAKLYRITGCS